MTRFYVTQGTTRRSLRSGAEFAGARGKAFVAGVGKGVKLEREPHPDPERGQEMLTAAMAKRARKAAARARQGAPS